MNITPTAARHDTYRHMHKGLRAAMFDAVLRLGRLDPDDQADLHDTLLQAERLLGFMAAHVKHENEHVHTALEARRPGAARRTADDHVGHLDALQALREQVAALGAAAAAQREALAHRLYLDLARFVAENLEHMHVEETQNNALLWSLYSDAELEAVHERLLASVEPASMMEAIGWMAQGLSLPELARVLADMARKAPPPAFQAALVQVRQQLGAARADRLSQLLELAPAL